MEAMSLGHTYIGCEHLLPGLIGETEGIAGQALRAAGAELPLSRRAVTAAIAGYAHLRAQQTKDAATAVAIRHDMQHVTQRLDRLEQRLAALTGDEAGEATGRACHPAPFLTAPPRPLKGPGPPASMIAAEFPSLWRSIHRDHGMRARWCDDHGRPIRAEGHKPGV
jgi:hypothetical protein